MQSPIKIVMHIVRGAPKQYLIVIRNALNNGLQDKVIKIDKKTYQELTKQSKKDK